MSEYLIDLWTNCVDSENHWKNHTRCSHFPKFSANPEHVGMVSKCSETMESSRNIEKQKLKIKNIILFINLRKALETSRTSRTHVKLRQNIKSIRFGKYKNLYESQWEMGELIELIRKC